MKYPNLLPRVSYHLNEPVMTVTIRNIIIFILLILSCNCGNAQQVTQGAISTLQRLRAATVRYDFSNAMVGNESYKDFVQSMIYKEGDDFTTKFDEDLVEIISDFIEEYNDTNSPLILTTNKDTKATMTIYVKYISSDGNKVEADYVFTDKETEKLLVSIQMTAKDGRCGSFTNLMGDAFEAAGKKLGKYIKKNLK